jgi:hypothetical protein
MHQSSLVLLKGGPDDLPQGWEAPPGGFAEQVKILRRNGYEHFEFAYEYSVLDGETMPIYRWCYRTFIAE